MSTDTTCTCSPAVETSKDCCDMPERLLALADAAWEELVKEKMKAVLVKECGEKLDKIAELAVTANKAKWQSMIQGKVTCQEYQADLKALMTDCCNQ